MLFTAVLVMQRAETASITLDTPLAEFYPDLPNALVITYRDLLATSQWPGRLHRRRRATRPGARSRRTQGANARDHHRRRDAISRRASASSTTTATTCCWATYSRRSTDVPTMISSGGRSPGSSGLARTYFAGTSSSTLESLSYLHTSTGWVAQPQTDPSVAGGARGVMSTPAELSSNHGQRSSPAHW